MEPVSLAVSIASLAPLLQTALDCFQYIRLGKAFGKDFERCLLQLDSVQLRLSRWGQAVGLGSDTASIGTLDNSSIAEEDKERVETRLGHIVSLFEDAEKVSRSVSAKSDGQGDSKPLEPSKRSFHQRIVDICLRRQKHTSIGKKTKWALYKQEDFNNLIASLQIHVHDLVELFPAVTDKQRALCDEEAEELCDEPDLPLLKTVAQELDLPLAEAIDRLEKRSAAATYNTTRNFNSHIGNQNTGTQNISGGMTFS